MTGSKLIFPKNLGRAASGLGLALALGACAHQAPAPTTTMPLSKPSFVTPSNPRIPLFATAGWEPFTRADAVGIATREWRLFGQLVDDDPPDSRPEPLPEQKPERMPGLWQRVGEYWWVGLDPSDVESSWTGIHDETGTEYDPHRDGFFAWSAAFISYVMRISGARDDFPYAASHAIYINIAASGGAKALTAFAPSAYAPQLGDLICTTLGAAANKIHFADLPTARVFTSHCDMVIAHGRPDQITVVGGNVDDAVTAKHIPLTADGKLADPSGQVIDTRYPWLVVLRVNYVR